MHEQGQRSEIDRAQSGALIECVTGMPAEVRAEVAGLADAIDAQVPAKTADNLLIATWNLRALGKIGRAACRERVEILGGRGSLKKTKSRPTLRHLCTT